MITERIEDRIFHYLTHKILETPGTRLRAIGGVERHIHIATNLQPNLLVSDWIGKLKGSSCYYIDNQREHHKRGNTIDSKSTLTTMARARSEKDVKTPFESIPNPSHALKGAWLFAAERGKTAKAASLTCRILYPPNRAVEGELGAK